jgi:hypothetical protein
VTLVLAIVLAASPACEREREQWTPFGFEAPCALMVGKPKQRFVAVQTQWKIDDDDAAMCAASAASVQVEKGATDARRAAQDWVQCLERWPRFDAILIGAHFAELAAGGGFHAGWETALRRTHGLDHLRRVHFLLEHQLGPPSLTAEALLSEGAPGVEAVFGSSFFDDDLKLDVGLRYLGTNPATEISRPTLPCGEAALVARDVMAGLVRGGHLHLASETWRDLPACVRETLTAQRGVDGGAAAKVPAGLALALLSTGHAEDARRIPLEPLAPDASKDDQFVRALEQALAHGRRTLDAEAAATLFASLHAFPVEGLPLAMTFLAPRDELARQQLATALDPAHRKLKGGTSSWRLRDAHGRALKSMQAALGARDDAGTR